MGDFYKNKYMVRGELFRYLMKLNEKPDNFNALKFEAFINGLANQTGMSVKTIEKELQMYGFNYNKQKMVLERNMNAYDALEGGDNNDETTLQ